MEIFFCLPAYLSPECHQVAILFEKESGSEIPRPFEMLHKALKIPWDFFNVLKILESKVLFVLLELNHGMILPAFLNASLFRKA